MAIITDICNYDTSSDSASMAKRDRKTDCSPFFYPDINREVQWDQRRPLPTYSPLKVLLVCLRAQVHFIHRAQAIVGNRCILKRYTYPFGKSSPTLGGHPACMWLWHSMLTFRRPSSSLEIKDAAAHILWRIGVLISDFGQWQGVVFSLTLCEVFQSHSTVYVAHP